MSFPDQDSVRHVARLARLRLPAEDEARFAEEFVRILDFIQILDQLPADRPSATATPAPTPMREDEVSNLSQPEAMLANAPSRSGDLIRVPVVVDGDE